MAKRGQTAAVSALVLTLGMSGVGVVAAAPFMGTSANAASGHAAVVRAIPSELGPSDNVGFEEPPPEVEVTVTVTATPEPEPSEVTTTVTVTPTPTPTPTPKRSSEPSPSRTQEPVQPPPATQEIQPPPPVQPTTEEPSVQPTTEEPSIQLPPAETATPADTVPTEEASASEEVPVELREAAPEYDQRRVSWQLSIPALVLVLLALAAVLVFEGRLRRLAHAAAVRKAGPRARRSGGGETTYYAYPAGAGYSSSVYPQAGYVPVNYAGGTAYAPIISLVPVHTYPAGYPQGYPAGAGLGHVPGQGGVAPHAPYTESPSAGPRPSQTGDGQSQQTGEGRPPSEEKPPTPAPCDASAPVTPPKDRPSQTAEKDGPVADRPETDESSGDGPGAGGSGADESSGDGPGAGGSEADEQSGDKPAAGEPGEKKTEAERGTRSYFEPFIKPEPPTLIMPPVRPESAPDPENPKSISPWERPG